MDLGANKRSVEVIMVAASVLDKKGKYYPQNFFYMNAHISYKNAAKRKN